MKIAFDDIIFKLQKSGGASVYWREITTRIAAREDTEITHLKSSKWIRGIPTISNADIFHSSHFRFSAFGKAKNVTTSHDLIYELGIVSGGVGAQINLYERKQSYFTADAIICISESTKHDLLQIYPSLRDRCPIYVIHHGLTVDSKPIRNASDKKTLPEFPFLLYVGGRDGYKNFKGALEGYSLSGLWRDGLKLLCTGKKFDSVELELFKKMGLDKMLVCEEHVTTSRLYDLYRNAFCLLYTSTYEGFGLPPIEAMSCGCPVIASNISSIPEVVGDAGILVNPLNVEDISTAIIKFQNDNLRNEFKSKGIRHSKQFSWDKSSLAHFQVYNNLISR